MKDNEMNLSSSTDILLSQKEERYQSLDLDNGMGTVILSIYDDLLIGSQSILDDLTQTPTVYLYAEKLSINKSIKFKSALLSANEVQSATEEMAVIDISGKNGEAPTPPVNTNPNVAGVKGGNGGDAGVLCIYIETTSPDRYPFQVNAVGGNGGSGQLGTSSAPGGDGGDGGRGGTVSILALHPYLRIAKALERVYRNQNSVDKRQMLEELLKAEHPFSDSEVLQQALKEEADSATLQAAIDQEESHLQVLASRWERGLYSNVQISKGKYGVYGAGNPGGETGKEKEDGKKEIFIFGSMEDIPARLPKNVFSLWIHPNQCQMLMEKAKLLYFVADPISNPSALHDATILFRRLQQRTAPFYGLNDTAPLAVYWNQNEREIGTHGSIETFKSLYMEATRYLNQLEHGTDFYGYAYNYVPLASFDFYQNQLKDLIANFQQLYNSYQRHFAQFSCKTHDLTAIKNAREQAKAVIEITEEKRDKLDTMSIATVNLIDSYQSQIAQKKQAVLEKLQQFEQILTHTFGFNFQELFTSLGALAFAPKSKINWAAQAGQLLYGTLTQIADDQGNQINKKYIINRVKEVEASVDQIIEGYKTLDDGTLESDDPSAAKLITEEQSLETLIQNLSDKFPEATGDLKEAFLEYVNTVVERNTEITKYNMIINLLVQTHSEIKQLNDKLAAYNDEAIANLPYNWPDLTAFISRLYYTARAQILETLELTTRSFQFWALSEKNLLAEALAHTAPPRITPEILRAAHQSITTAYNNAVENYRRASTHFPAEPSDTGILYELTPAQINMLKQHAEVIVKITVAKNSTKRHDNPFADMANVRITKVRLWVEGVKTDNHSLHVYLKHGGKEQITDPFRTEPYSFGHETLFAQFEYNLESKKITEHDGSIGFSGDDTKQQTTYALVGPFTNWHIDMNHNDGLNLSGLYKATLEFHGTNYPFYI